MRKAIFTFANIKDRVSERDIPRVQRDLGQNDLLLVISGAEKEDEQTVNFILENISQRLAENLRAEAAEGPKPSTTDCEAAMMRIVNVVRELEGSGEIFLVAKDE